MKARVQQIAIQNFKAFREFTLNLEGRHLLLYGANGSGKSSLYWALYTFMQSAQKDTDAVSRYFEPGHRDCLLNIHVDAVEKPGEITLTVRNTATGKDTKYPIGKDIHSTQEEPAVLKGDLASDFITYRFFFGFSNFRNSETFDLWPLFEKEILPFCVSTRGSKRGPDYMWKWLAPGNPNPTRVGGRAGRAARENYRENLETFNDVLGEITDKISEEAQGFYDDHFAEDDPAKITLKLGVTTPASLNENNCVPPKLQFGIQIGGQTIPKPQIFLNEAKITQLALSVRFGASLVNLHDSDIKLLVLDDLLVSLDMSNRMKVVELLLSDTFENYQKIILTHDLGFFREFRRMIGDEHTDWCFRSLTGNAKDGISEKHEKSPIEKATDYLQGHDLEEAAQQLRKAVEETAQRYRRYVLKQELPPGQFHSLSKHLEAARKHLSSKIPESLFQSVLADTPAKHRDKLVRVTDDDLDNDPDLDSETKEELKAQRQRLRQFMSESAWQHLKTIQLLDRVLRMKDRVLNPAAHWGETPLYDAEVKRALDLVDELEKRLR